MPGPMPKDPALRQRRNKSSTRALLPAEISPRMRAPRLPELEKDEKGIEQTWHALTKKYWAAIWSSPMSHEFLRADEPALYRLIVLANKFFKTGSLNAAKEIRMIEREFGLTPLSRRRLEWTVAVAEEAQDQHEEKRARRAQIVDVDPRGALDE